jgi:hypothetical protein
LRVSAVFAPGRRHSGRCRIAGAQPHRVSGPELAAALLASGARHPAERIHSPSGCDRTGADVGFAERSGIGMPGNTETHLAPHNRHSQLIADHRPRGNRYAGAIVSARHGPSAGTGLDVGPGLRAGMGRGGKDLNPGVRPVRRSGGGRFRPRSVGADGPRGMVSRPSPGVAAVAQFGKPVAHLEHAGVLWPNVGLHLSPFLGQGSAPASLFALSTWHCAHRRAPVRFGVPGSGDARHGRLRSRRAAITPPGTLPAVSWHLACRRACPGAYPPRSGRLPVCRILSFYASEPTSQSDKLPINIRLIYRSSRRGMWTIPRFPSYTGCELCSRT